jgi:hypothetical protein
VEHYTYHLDYFLFGPGQGSNIGPLLWLICFLLIVKSLSTAMPSMVFRSVHKSLTVRSRGDAFVDDAGLGYTLEVTPPGMQYIRRSISHLTNSLETLAQQWEWLLFSTGGAMNLQKCFWFLVTWHWENGRAVLATSKPVPATISLTAGDKLDDSVEIRRIEPTESYRTLGVHISPRGSNKGAITKLEEIILDYAQALTGSHMSKEETLTSYVQHLLPKLWFQLPALSLSAPECNKLMSTIWKSTLPRLHFNRNMARSIVHGPLILGGMALPHLATVQGIDKLHLLLGHIRLGDNTSALIRIDMSYVQMICGSNKFFMNLPYPQSSWVEWGWLVSVWSQISDSSLTITYPDVRIFTG